MIKKNLLVWIISNNIFRSKWFWSCWASQWASKTGLAFMGYSRSRFDGVLFLYANQRCQKLQSLRFSISCFYPFRLDSACHATYCNHSGTFRHFYEREWWQRWVKIIILGRFGSHFRYLFHRSLDSLQLRNHGNEERTVPIIQFYLPKRKIFGKNDGLEKSSVQYDRYQNRRPIRTRTGTYHSTPLPISA